MATPPAPINERMIPSLNAFSTAVDNCKRQYADGTMGVPMLLDGSWQHFKTVKNRFVDKTNEYGFEEYRSTDNRPGDLTSAEGKLWTSVQNKIYAVTMGMMTDEVADLYRDETAELAADGRVNEQNGKGRTLWLALEQDCGGGQVEVQTIVLSTVTDMAQMPDDANPLQAARLLLTDARRIRPAMADQHIRDIMLKKLPACMSAWVTTTSMRRSDRAGFRSELAGSREILAWLQLEVTNNKTYPWNRSSGGKRMQALQAQADEEELHLYPQYSRQGAHASLAPPAGSRRATTWDFYCYNCDGGGHHAYMCPSPRRDERPQQQRQQQPGGMQQGVAQRPPQRPPFRGGKGGFGGKGGGGKGGGKGQARQAQAHSISI